LSKAVPRAETTLTVVIPAYNEEQRLPPTLDRAAEYLSSAGFSQAEIVVVDDGSSDHTVEITKAAAARLERPGLSLRVVSNPGNRGKGYSVRHGMRESQGDWVLFSDADLSAPIEELDKLWEAVATQGYDVAIGSRALDRSLIGERQPLFREVSGRVFNLAVRIVARLPFADTQCGFKLFSRAATDLVASKQLVERFGFDVEQLYLARHFGFKIAEVPVRWNDVEGTKVSTLSGVDAFVDVARVRWNSLTGKYR
jgi:dolichyl-phosphate beta-glucosyltransferase